MQKFRPVVLLTAATLVAGVAQARTKLVALPERAAVTVRLDHPSATLVEEERLLTLQEGENRIDFSWRGVDLDPDSIRLTPRSAPGDVVLLSVSYPPGEAALVWRLTSRHAREERVRISYLLAGLDRLVTYRAVAAPDEQTLDLEGHLVLRNFSGEDFDRAAFTLGEGDAFTGRIAHEETRQFPVFSAKGVRVTKTFTWDAALLPWEPRRQDGTVDIPVHYVVENARAAGLGHARLWGGKIRVFQPDGRGGTVFLGEDRFETTPTGETLKIRLGDSREVAVTQRKTRDAAINHRPSVFKPVLFDTDEVIETEVESFKDGPVTVDLIQHIPGEWALVEASLVPERRDANTLVFSVTVPARGKERLTFHYQRRNVRR